MKTISLQIITEAVGIFLLLSTGSALRAQGFSDNFSGTTLNPGWIVVNPNPDSSVYLSGTGSLTMIASPLHGGSDLNAAFGGPGANENAPRILQPVDPYSNWIIQTAIQFNPTNEYQSAEVLLATSTAAQPTAGELWRIAERTYDTGITGTDLVGFGNQTFTRYSGGTTFLQIEKNGTQYSGSWSSDGTNWNAVWTGNNTTTWTYFGLATIRQPWDNDLTVASTANFNYFQVTFIPWGSYSAWQQAHFPGQSGTSALAAETASPTGDGISNLMKYALDLDPWVNGAKGLPQARTITLSGIRYPTLSYKQLIDAPDISYTVQVSGDLKTWTSGNTSVLSATPNGDGVTQTVVVQALTPIGSTSRQFMRLQVTHD